MTDTPRHVSVLADAVLTWLDPQPGQIWVDATVGAGGHARRLAERVGPTGRLIGLDQDATMLELARPRLHGLTVTLVEANFDQLPAILAHEGIPTVDGVLADLGFCSDQLDDPQRGLSFLQEGPLDMRLAPEQGESAADLIARLSERGLADLFWIYGEERYSRRIARRIVEERQQSPITTTRQLAELIRRSVPRPRSGHHRIDPATRVFQALRIAVNDELGALERLLRWLPDGVRIGGRVGIISFHSLEDRPVKQAFRSPPWRALTKKPIEASEEEIRTNSRARSARLRVAERCPWSEPEANSSGERRVEG